MKTITKGKLLEAIQKYAGKYQISLQLWGTDDNNIYVYKNDIELFCSGGQTTAEEALMDALDYLYRINSVPLTKRLKIK